MPNVSLLHMGPHYNNDCWKEITRNSEFEYPLIPGIHKEVILKKNK